MDDAALKQVLNQWASKEHPLEACFKAAPREELEAKLGFSLDPAYYAKKAAEKQREAASVEAASHADDTLTEEEIQRLASAGDSLASLAPAVDEGAVEPAEVPEPPAAEAPVFEDPIFAAPIPETAAVCETPMKPTTKSSEVINISPTTPAETELHVSSFLRKYVS